MPKEYNIQDGESIFDVVLATYGKLDYTYKLILENQDPGGNNYFENVDMSLENNPGMIISYDDTFVVPEQEVTTRSNEQEIKNSSIVQEGQSIYDVALMLYGNVEKVLKIIADANVETLNHSIQPGVEIAFESDLIDDKVLIDYLQKNNLVINTSSPASTINTGSGFNSGFDMSAFF